MFAIRSRADGILDPIHTASEHTVQCTLLWLRCFRGKDCESMAHRIAAMRTALRAELEAISDRMRRDLHRYNPLPLLQFTDFHAVVVHASPAVCALGCRVMGTHPTADWHVLLLRSQ